MATQIDGRDVELAMWDTSGKSSEYATLREMSYEGVDAILLCFSISDPVTFERIESFWVKEIERNVPGIPILLVGCKSEYRGGDKELVREREAVKVGERIRAIEYKECRCVYWVMMLAL